MQSGSIQGGALPWILLPMALGAAFWVGASTLASLFGAWADAWAAAVEADADDPAAGLDAAEWGLHWAMRLDPLSPDHRQGYARVLEMRGARLPPGSREALSLFDQALVHYGSAARARPTWPYTWLALARVKARSGSLDAEFEAAYRRGCDLGRWDPKAQTLALDLGLTLWGLLSPDARELTQGALERSLSMQPSATLFKAVGAGRIDLVAPLVAGDAGLERLLANAIRAQPDAVRRGPRT